MITITESTNFDFNYLLDKYPFPDYDKYKGKNVFYHNTYFTNVDEISKNGLKCDKAKAEYDKFGVIPMIWCVNTPGGAAYGGCTVAFNYNLTRENGNQVNDNEFNLFEDVSPQDIIFIDTWISDRNSLGRVSDVHRLINRVGEDRFRSTLLKSKERGAEFFYDIDYLIECALR